MANRTEPGMATNLSRRTALRRAGTAAALIVGSGVPSRQTAAAQGEEAPPSPTETSIPPDFKVVLHAAESQNWQFVLSNLRNLTQEWPQARLRVVVDGSAVTNLQGQNSLTNELGTLAAAGVQLQVCPNALREHEIDAATIPSYAQTSLGGVVALVLAHREGYVYVKP